MFTNFQYFVLFFMHKTGQNLLLIRIIKYTTTLHLYTGLYIYGVREKKYNYEAFTSVNLMAHLMFFGATRKHCPLTANCRP